MFKRFLVIVASSLTLHATTLCADGLLAPDPKAAPASTKTTTKEILTDAAIAALIIAGSIALYKSTGHPCACPSDTMRNGRACGGRSAWSKAGGAKPLCFPTDITAEMKEIEETPHDKLRELDREMLLGIRASLLELKRDRWIARFSGCRSWMNSN